MYERCFVRRYGTGSRRWHALAAVTYWLLGWRLLFEALWPKHREKIRVVRTDIDRHTLLLRREVQFEHIQREHEARSRSLAHFEATENAHRRQEYRGIVADISPKVYDGKLNWLQGRTCIGTGNWLLRDATFIQWLKATEKSQRLLWLQGIPGAGLWISSLPRPLTPL